MELNLMGQRVTQSNARRQSKYNTKYRGVQNVVYCFLERPRGFFSIAYHVSVFGLIFVCLLLSVISSTEIEREENTRRREGLTKIKTTDNSSNTSSDALLPNVAKDEGYSPKNSPEETKGESFSSSTVEESVSFSGKANKALHKLEIVLVVIFSLDLFLRVWSAGCRSRYQTFYGRLRFLKQPFTFLDLFICVVSFVIILTGTENNKVFAASSLRGLRFLQILRIVRMDRRGGTWRLLGSVVYLHRQELVTTFYIGFLGLIFASLLMYNLENNPVILEDGSPDQAHGRADDFKTYADCLWWGIVTLTTVGYGDKVPVTSGGKMVASFFAIMGISFFALPAGILGSGFALKVQEQQRQKHFARRRHPAATLLQCVWRCYAAGEDSLSVATWTIHVVAAQAIQSPLTYNNNNNFGGGGGSSTNPISRKRPSTLMERIPSIRGRKLSTNTPKTSTTNNGCAFPISSPTGKTPARKSSTNYQREMSEGSQNYARNDAKRKASILSLNFDAYFPAGFFSNPSSRKNSMNESEIDPEDTPKRLTKLRPKHKIAIRFIRRMKYFRARIKFKEALKPYDVKDVIEQYASGHVDLITRVKDVQSKFALVVGQKDRKKQESSFSKLTVAARVVKIENQLTHLERKLDHLIFMYRKDKTKAFHNMHVQAAISSSEDESTPLSNQKMIPPAQLFVKTRQMDLLSPIISRSRSHSQPNALTDCFLNDEPMNSSGSGLFQSSPTVSRQASCFLNVPKLDQSSA